MSSVTAKKGIQNTREVASLRITRGVKPKLNETGRAEPDSLDGIQSRVWVVVEPVEGSQTARRENPV